MVESIWETSVESSARRYYVTINDVWRATIAQSYVAREETNI